MMTGYTINSEPVLTTTTPDVATATVTVTVTDTDSDTDALNNEIIPIVDALPADTILLDETGEATDEYDPSEYSTIG
jgi:hypothetical protein